MAVDPTRAKSLFLAASDLTDPAARAAYLDAACGDDVALRQRVEALLAADDPAGPVRAGHASGISEATAPASQITIPEFEAKPPGTSETVTREQSAGGSGGTVRASRLATSLVGQIIAGRYTLLDVLGEGGMGTVYRAGQTQPLRRQVALKLIRIGMDSRAVLARFDAERQALALMDHPNIARVYDGGTTETGQPYFVMELVKGNSITDYCDRLRLPVKTRLELFVPVCQAVQHAHQKGIIHRDLKPSNVMVTEVDGRATPKVIDFGVAKATEFDLTDHSLADTGAIVGTPTYMSPEQADPSSMDIDTRTDVYALGVILYELLAGSPPIDAKQFRRGALLEMLRMVREVDPPKPSTKVSTADALPNIAASRDADPAHLKRTLQGDLDWIVMRALEKDRSRRYATVNGFAADIQRHLAHEPVVAAPPSRTYRTRKFIRKHRGAVIAASLVLLSSLGGLAAAVAVQSVANTRLAASLRRETSANTALALANGKLVESHAAVQVQLARAEWLLYADMLMQAQNDFESGDGGLALHYLDACQANLRGWEHRYLWTRINARQTLVGHTASVFGAAFSPDGQRIVTGSIDRTAKVWDAATGQELVTLKGHTVPIMRVAFSPDGQRIVTGAGWWGNNLTHVGETKVWDAATGRELRTLKGDTRRVFSVEFSPDGQRILTGSDDATARVWDAATGQELLTLPGHKSWVWSAAFSPNSQHIVTGSYDRSVKVWDAKTGRELRALKAHAGFVRGVAYSPDGQRILTCSDDSTAKVWDAERGQNLTTFESGGIFGVAYSPDGQRLVSAGGDMTARVWDMATGREIVALKGHSETVWSVAFSPDGQRIVTGAGKWPNLNPGEARVWDATTGKELVTLKGKTPGVSGVAYSPNGRQIVTGCVEGTVKVWDAATGREQQTLKGHTRVVWSAAFSPDGQRIVTASDDTTARVWDAATGREQLVLQGHTDKVRRAVFSPDGQRIITCGCDRTVKLWDAGMGQEVLALKHDGRVWGVAFSPDGHQVAGGGPDSQVTVWFAEKGQRVVLLRGHADVVTSVAFSPDGQRIFGWDAQKRVLAWLVASGKPIDPVDPPAMPRPGPADSPDGFRRAVPEGKLIALTDRRRPTSDNLWALPVPAERVPKRTEPATPTVGRP